MQSIRISAVQFEHSDGDKAYNLDRMRALARTAASQGAQVVCFHECCISGYTWLQTLDRAGLLAVAEPIPSGPSLQVVAGIARALNIVVMAGLVERDAEDRCFNAYVAIDPAGVVRLHHRKLHTFVNPHLTPGDRYNVAEILGTKFGCLICYDNNLPENVRITTLMGAEVVVMPHVTGGTPSPMPGRGPIDPALWDGREAGPARLRREFLGPKGREWLLRWLPARAWENGVFAVFSNCVGRDGGTIKPGLAMIIDPDGEIMTESNALGDDLVVATLSPDRFVQALGRRYLRARRPDLYAELVAPPPAGAPPETRPGWRTAQARD